SRAMDGAPCALPLPKHFNIPKCFCARCPVLRAKRAVHAPTSEALQHSKVFLCPLPGSSRKARRARSHFRSTSLSKVFLCPLPGFSRKARRARSHFQNTSTLQSVSVLAARFLRHFLSTKKAPATGRSFDEEEKERETLHGAGFCASPAVRGRLLFPADETIIRLRMGLVKHICNSFSIKILILSFYSQNRS
ncbi:MAG: hypothetical protein Q4F18_15325, partial [Clostridia bacterium]|nr:hypothetical protein [Clostridia bacterium]